MTLWAGQATSAPRAERTVGHPAVLEGSARERRALPCRRPEAVPEGCDHLQSPLRSRRRLRGSQHHSYRLSARGRTLGQAQLLTARSDAWTSGQQGS